MIPDPPTNVRPDRGDGGIASGNFFTRSRSRSADLYCFIDKSETNKPKKDDPFTFRRRILDTIFDAVKAVSDDIHLSSFEPHQSAFHQHVPSVAQKVASKLAFSKNLGSRFDSVEKGLRQVVKDRQPYKVSGADPPPKKGEFPSLDHVSDPGKMWIFKPAYPVPFDMKSLSFQETSTPSPSDIRLVDSTRSDRGVKDVAVTLQSAAFRNLERSTSSSIRGVSTLLSLTTSLTSLIAKPKDSKDQKEVFLKEDVDPTTLGCVWAGVQNTLEALASELLNTRVQLAGLARDGFLEKSGFDEREKQLLRSLPLEKDSLFDAGWLKQIVDARTADNRDRVFHKFLKSKASDSSHPGGKRKTSGGSWAPAAKKPRYQPPPPGSSSRTDSRSFQGPRSQNRQSGSGQPPKGQGPRLDQRSGKGSKPPANRNKSYA